jgi:hypothetical protein
MHHGGCLCGGVRYRVTGALRDVVFCHCSQCRRQTGLFYAATAAATADVSIEPTGALTWYAASHFAERGFCGTCGSALFWKPKGGDYIAILAGSLDDASGLRPAYHICVEGRATFYDLADGLPQYPGDAPDLPTAAG